jgi:hypothetical protein
MTNEKIKAAAVYYKSGRIYTGACHLLAHAEALETGELSGGCLADGFVTTLGRFVDREQAFELAQNAQQTNANAWGRRLESEMVVGVDVAPIFASEGCINDAYSPQGLGLLHDDSVEIARFSSRLGQLIGNIEES